MTRVAALYRLSSTKQVKAQRREEGDDIPGQRAAVRRFLEARPEWKLLPAHEYEEPGVSAFKKRIHERPVLLKVLDAAKSGDFDVLCVFREDRLSRGDEDSGAELLYILSELERAGVKVWSVADQKHLTVKGTQLVIRAVEADTANQESKKTSMRVKNGNRTAAEAGRWHGGRTPLGYILEPLMDGGLPVIRSGRVVNEIKPHPQYTSVVQALYERYLAGQGTPALAAWLNATGIPSFSGKGWDSNGVKNVLKNRFYLGEVGWHQSGRTKDDGAPFFVKGQHQPIIDEGLFDQVQRMRGARARIPERQLSPKYALGGVGYCECGARLGGITRESGQKQYRCRAWVMQGLCPAGTKHLPAEEIERNFVAAIKRAGLPGGLRDLLEVDLQQQQRSFQEAVDRKKRAQGRLKQLEGELARVRSDYRAGKLGVDDYNTFKGDIETERTVLEEELAKPLPVAEPMDFGAVVTLAVDIEENWAAMDPEEQKAFSISFTKGWRLKVIACRDKSVHFERE